MKNIFKGVAGNNPTLNRFDLSYTNTLSMSFGYLYPVQCDEVYPGDVFKMSCYCHAELMPMVAPIMSDIQMFAHVFFVPYRLIYGVDNEDGKSIWEKFITGGEDGDYDTALPAWSPSWTAIGFSSLKIWDYVGNPVSYVKSGSGTELDPFVYTWSPIVPSGIDVSIAPKYSYNFIYNSFYRDENLVNEVSLDNEDLLLAAFKKDYFTSALEAQQRGTAPALPVDISFAFGTGAYGRVYNSDVASGFSIGSLPVLVDNSQPLLANQVYGTAPNTYGVNWSSSGGSQSDSRYPAFADGSSASISGAGHAALFLNNLTINDRWNEAIKATTFTVSDMRLVFSIQRMLELAQRSGYRYTEWLQANFDAHPTDARLDRPEYIGGCVMSVSVSPLTQNSESSTTPQGTKVGIGHIDAVQEIGNYRVLEHGLIMTLVSIVPKPIYKQGINRQWLRQSRFDYYNPALAYLSEQGVYNAELFVGGSSDVDPDSGLPLDSEIFGYQAHWNEMRAKNNMVSGAVRDQFSHWTLARNFSTRPALNQDFLEIDENDFNQIFAVQNEDTFIVSWSNLIDCYRPIPAYGIPGLIDHVYGGM